MNECDGFCNVDVVPSPKFHDHDVGPPVDVSEKAAVNGAVPDVGVAVKLAVGAGGGEVVAGLSAISWPTFMALVEAVAMKSPVPPARCNLESATSADARKVPVMQLACASPVSVEGGVIVAVAAAV